MVGKMSQDIDTEKIISHFKGHTKPYLEILDMKGHIIIEFINKHSNADQSILEVGGGNGNFLDNVFRYTPVRRLTNLEITHTYAKYQINKNAIFINGTVTQLPFKNNSFDFVVARSVLHHLIGSSRKKSKENCRIAVSEMMRITKDGGYICIGEMYNKYAFFSSIVFYVTLLLSKVGITCKYFDIHKDVTISVLTPAELKDLVLNNDYPIKLEYERLVRHLHDLKWKLTILMSNVGSAFLIGKKLKFQEGIKDKKVLNK